MPSHLLWLISRTILMLFNTILLLSKDDPVVLIVILVAVSLEEVLEHVSHGSVLRSLIKSEVSALTEILHKLNWVSLAENFNGSGEFLLLNSLILVSLVVCLESLPRKHSSQEVHSDIANAFHVISAGFIKEFLPCSIPR